MAFSKIIAVLPCPYVQAVLLDCFGVLSPSPTPSLERQTAPKGMTVMLDVTRRYLRSKIYIYRQLKKCHLVCEAYHN